MARIPKPQPTSGCSGAPVAQIADKQLTNLTDLINDLFIVSSDFANSPGKFAPAEDIVWVSPDSASKLIRGDALELLAKMPSGSVDCVWTDPPYMLSNDGITCHAGKMVSVNKGDWDKSKGLMADHEFNLAWTAECKRALKPGGTIWVTGTLHIYPSVGMALLQNGYRLLNDIIWVKPNPPPNLGRRTFTHSTEVVLWATHVPKGSKNRYTFNYEDMKRENGGKQMKTVWKFTAPGASEKQFGKHPTQKPVALIDRCLRASTNAGDLVLDPFAGSGSTGVAALRTGRRFVGIDIDCEFLDIARQRMEQMIYPPPIFLGMVDIFLGYAMQGAWIRAWIEKKHWRSFKA